MNTNQKTRFRVNFSCFHRSLSLEAFTSLSITNFQFFSSLLSQLFPLKFFTTEFTFTFSNPILSHLNCFPSHPSLVFHFILLSLLPLVSFQTPTLNFFPHSTLFLFLLISFFRSQLQPFLFSYGIKCLFNSPENEAGTPSLPKLLSRCSALPKGIQLQHRHILEKLLSFFLYSLVRCRIMK